MMLFSRRPLSESWPRFESVMAELESDVGLVLEDLLECDDLASERRDGNGSGARQFGGG
jgi:hypothetical protein